MTFDEFLPLLKGVLRSGHDRARALCPAHLDKGQSFNIKRGQDGGILVHCFAGCRTEEVVKTLGLTLADLYPRRNGSESQNLYEYQSAVLESVSELKESDPDAFWDLVKSSTLAEPSAWAKAVPAPDFLANPEPAVDWLVRPLLAPGSITEFFSPRGIGKTHVAHALAVQVARDGKRVLILDRDNSRREIRRRLGQWGAGDVPTLKVMTRDEAPPLTDRETWTAFPFREYDLVIIDSLDASAEGVGEKDSSKPSRAIAPILDLAHRAAGPAILVLGNTIKSGEHGRGCGVIEDRADIVFEVRDCTGLRPTGTKDWWLELPPGGVGAWAKRASRRKRRSVYRLAFVPSKFRVGEEPEPFVFEIRLEGELWTCRDVIAEVVQMAEQARFTKEQEHQHKMDRAALALVKEIRHRQREERPILWEKEAVPFLQKQGLGRNEARELLRQEEGRKWWTEEAVDKRGKLKVLKTYPTAAELPSAETNAGLVKNLDGGSSLILNPENNSGDSVGSAAALINPDRRKFPLPDGCNLQGDPSPPELPPPLVYYREVPPSAEVPNAEPLEGKRGSGGQSSGRFPVPRLGELPPQGVKPGGSSEPPSQGNDRG